MTGHRRDPVQECPVDADIEPRRLAGVAHPEQDALAFGMEIERGMEVDGHGRAAADGWHCSANEHMTLGRHDRNRYPIQLAELSSPGAGANHDLVAVQLAVRGADALDPIATPEEACDRRAFTDLDAEPAGGVRVSEGYLRRSGEPIARTEHRASQV